MERSDRGTFIGSIITTLNTMFPNAFNLNTKEQKKLVIKVCEKVLCKFPNNVISKATEHIISTYTFPPKVADIVNECKKLMGGSTDEELWDVFAKALHKADVEVYRLGTSDRPEAQKNLNELFNSLPEEIQAYCHSVNEFVRIQREEDRTFLKNKFVNRIPILREQIEIEKKYPNIVGLGERLRLVGGHEKQPKLEEQDG